jgi:hypothetical protein
MCPHVTTPKQKNGFTFIGELGVYTKDSFCIDIKEINFLLTHARIKSRRMTWARHVVRMGEINAYGILVVKPEEKRTRKT